QDVRRVAGADVWWGVPGRMGMWESIFGQRCLRVYLRQQNLRPLPERPRSDMRRDVPDGTGLWFCIFRRILRLQMRSVRRQVLKFPGTCVWRELSDWPGLRGAVRATAMLVRRR